MFFIRLPRKMAFLACIILIIVLVDGSHMSDSLRRLSDTNLGVPGFQGILDNLKHWQDMEKNDYLTACSGDDNLKINASVKCTIRFQNHGRAHAEERHSVVFAVKQRNAEIIENLLYQLSDPHHTSYGNYLTEQEVTALTSNPTASNAILTWLHSIPQLKISTPSTSTASSTFSTPSASSTSPMVNNDVAVDYISVESPIWILEALLNTQFYTFSSDLFPQKRAIAALHYSIPSILAPHVSAVFNTVQMPLELVVRPRPQAKRLTAAQLSTLQQRIFNKRDRDHGPSRLLQEAPTINGFAYPQLLNYIYDIESNEGNDLVSQAVFATNEQDYSVSDLAQFKSIFKLPFDKPSAIHNHERKESCPDVDSCAEGNLDIQYLTSISQKTPTYYWYERTGTSFAGFLYDVLRSGKTPNVLSISYAMPEHFVGPFEQQAFDMEAMKLGLRGVTIIAASGDEGASSGSQSTRSCAYTPYFPASSPWVLSVGATQGPESGLAETACTGITRCGITSGGGMSNIYVMPRWQSQAVRGYFASLSKDMKPYEEKNSYSRYIPFKHYNKDGRGYPDFSVLGSNYLIVVNGTGYVVSGTSASTPVAAAMISLVNAHRARENRPPLGWITPLIYMLNGSFINDVTKGDNRCLRQGEGCCKHGFFSTIGWDPVTGFGSINYKRFSDIFAYIGEPMQSNSDGIVGEKGGRGGGSGRGGGDPNNYDWRKWVPGWSNTHEPSNEPTAQPTALVVESEPTFTPTTDISFEPSASSLDPIDTAPTSVVIAEPTSTDIGPSPEPNIESEFPTIDNIDSGSTDGGEVVEGQLKATPALPDAKAPHPTPRRDHNNKVPPPISFPTAQVLAPSLRPTRVHKHSDPTQSPTSPGRAEAQPTSSPIAQPSMEPTYFPVAEPSTQPVPPPNHRTHFFPH